MAFTEHDYHLDEVVERLQDLLLVLQYDSEEERYFTTGERILINQQRGDLLRFKSYLFGQAAQQEVRYYQLPEAIEMKVETIYTIIKRNFWVPRDERVPDFR